MEGCRYKLRVVRYHEQGYRVLCEMMNRRWNADNWIIYKNA